MSIEPPKPLSDEPPDPDDLLKNDINRSIYRYLKKNPGWHDEITISNRVGTPLLTLRKYLAQLEGHLIEKQGDSLWRLETSIEQQLYKPKQLSLSVESSTSTQLLGDEKFLGYKSEDEQVMENPRKKSHPSIKNPRKTRRKKGLGNGSIYYRTSVKNGKEYTDAYYHYTENGKKRTKYIPKSLLDKVKEAESLKLPVADILVLLGGNNKNPRKKSDIPNEAIAETNNNEIDSELNYPRKKSPPSTKKRQQGYGGGYVEYKPIKRSGKTYPQYWYHYEFWENGDPAGIRVAARLIKSSKYIPKRLLAKVQKLDAQKAPVVQILELLGIK